MAITKYKVGLDLVVGPSKDMDGVPTLRQTFIWVEAASESRAIDIAMQDPSFQESVWDAWIEDEETEYSVSLNGFKWRKIYSKIN
jgi:hypothetical protein